MPTAPIDGVDLYYEVHGEGLPVVLCHGIGGNHASWFQQVGPFAERYRVVVFDHRAFGRSAFDPSANAGRGSWTTSRPCSTTWAFSGRRSWRSPWAAARRRASRSAVLNG